MLKPTNLIPKTTGENLWMVPVMQNVMNMVIHHVHDHDDVL